MPEVSVAVSPDADDLFMVRALLEGLIDTRGWTFRIETLETDRLNRMAAGEGPDVSAISVAWYPQLAERWQLLPHGGSAGEGYGPVIIAPTPRLRSTPAMSLGDLRGKRIAVPGLTTTAYAVLRMMVPDIEPVVTPITPYARIFEALRRGEVDAGLVIHEGRLTFQAEGFVQIADLGVWWGQDTGGLPLPLGGNAIKRSLGPSAIAEVSEILRSSIAHGLAHREEAISWLLARGGALKTYEQVDKYLSMYANQRTLDWGPDGRQAIQLLMDRMGTGLTVDFAP